METDTNMKRRALNEQSSAANIIGEPSSALKLIPPELGTSRTGLQEGTASFRSSPNNWHIVIIRVPTGTRYTYRLGWSPVPMRETVGGMPPDDTSRAQAAELSCQSWLCRALSGPPEYLSTLLPAASGCCTQQWLVLVDYREWSKLVWQCSHTFHRCPIFQPAAREK